MKLAYVSAVAVLLSGCAVSGAGDQGSSVEQDSSSTAYVDILEFAKTDQGAWYDTIHKLNAELTGVCGDTFCEGDWSNLTPLTFGCSVSSKAGTIKQCAWTFAASQVDVDVTTAGIFSNAPTFVCDIHAPTTAVKLEALLGSSPDALHAPLPGAPSIYDQLAGCFAHPIGSTPGRPAGTSPVTYVAASSYYTSAAGQQKWRDAEAALVHGFDNVCGDTFCSSDFGDLRSLDLECAVTKSTGKVKSCAWIFGGSYHVVVAHGGALQETAKTFRCPFTINGTLPQLIATLTAAGTQDAIQRPLPGVTTSAYDALAGCLP